MQIGLKLSKRPKNGRNSAALGLDAFKSDRGTTRRPSMHVLSGENIRVGHVSPSTNVMAPYSGKYRSSPLIRSWVSLGVQKQFLLISG